MRKFAAGHAANADKPFASATRNLEAVQLVCAALVLAVLVLAFRIAIDLAGCSFPIVHFCELGSFHPSD